MEIPNCNLAQTNVQFQRNYLKAHKNGDNRVLSILQGKYAYGICIFSEKIPVHTFTSSGVTMIQTQNKRRADI